VGQNFRCEESLLARAGGRLAEGPQAAGFSLPLLRTESWPALPLRRAPAFVDKRRVHCYTYAMSDQVAKQKAPARPRTKAPKAGEPVGMIAWIDAILEFIGEITVLTAQSFGVVVSGQLNVGDLVRQMAEIGADSLFIVMLVATATGVVFAYYTTNLAAQVGFTGFVGGTLGYAFLNELGPVLGGIAFAARSGAAIAAEIGSMVVTEQVDALRAMAVSPVRYLVAPRVLAAIIMLPLIIVLADVIGMYAGALSSARQVPLAVFWDSVRQWVVAADLINGMIKALVFAYIISIVACRQGLSTKGGATGVGRATTSSVVFCVVLITLADVILAPILTSISGARR